MIVARRKIEFDNIPEQSETEAVVLEEGDKAALDYLKKTAVTMTKATLETWLKLGELFAPQIEKRARAMGFEDPAEYLKSALDFFDAYRDKIESLETEIKTLKGEVALLSHLKPKILKAWGINEYNRLRNLYLAGIITEEAYIRSIELVKKMGDIDG
jgi:hypothetical protein